jgi:hypothetical protein
LAESNSGFEQAEFAGTSDDIRIGGNRKRIVAALVIKSVRDGQRGSDVFASGSVVNDHNWIGGSGSASVGSFQNDACWKELGVFVVKDEEVSVSRSEEVNGNRAKQVDAIISEWS